MLAVRDQENLVHAAPASKQLNQGTRNLQPKTPGNKYPKTPLKIPLNDENATTVFGGKSGKGKGLENMMTIGKKGTTFDKNSFVTPTIGPRERAPLGMKTTNAKAKAFQTPAGPLPGKELDKTQAKQQTSARRLKKITHAETIKLEVHSDETPLAEKNVEVEYAPPRAKDLPYQSDVFPDNCLNYDFVKPGNLIRGQYNYFHNKLDAQGRTRSERALEESYAKSTKDTEERIFKMLEEEDWTVGDVPETFRHLQQKEPERKIQVAQPVKKFGAIPRKAPATMVSRRAASALSAVHKTTTAPTKDLQPKTKPIIPFLSRSKPTPLPMSIPSTLRSNAATAASKSTIGYSKGRSASGTLQGSIALQNTFVSPQKRKGPMKRSVSNMSQASDTTITPSRFAQEAQENEEWKKRLTFLGAFDVDDELEPGLRGALPDCVRGSGEDEEEFVLTLGTGSG